MSFSLASLCAVRNSAVACSPNSASASDSSLSDACTALSVWISAFTLRSESFSYDSGGGPAFFFAVAAAAFLRFDAFSTSATITTTARISTSHSQARLPCPEFVPVTAPDEPALPLAPLPVAAA